MHTGASGMLVNELGECLLPHFGVRNGCSEFYAATVTNEGEAALVMRRV